MGRVVRLLLLLLAGCSAPSDGWDQRVLDLRPHGSAVIDAVGALPECAAAMEKGGIIHWRSAVICRGHLGPALGCSYPQADPPLVEVAFQSAWGDANPGTSVLAHELCHVCGYTDEVETEACARRAQASFVSPLVPPSGP